MLDLGGVFVTGQMNIFDFLEVEKFNPLQALALIGTGYVNGKKRVLEFFSKTRTNSEKTQFLKKEYGFFGIGMADVKPCRIHSMQTCGNKINYVYYDENNDFHEESITFAKLSLVIEDMIKKKKYE